MIKKGDYVKIRIQPERFWCRVDDVTPDGDVLFLSVYDELISTDSHGLSCGDGLIWPAAEVYEHCRPLKVCDV